MDVGLVPGREANDDGSDNEGLVDVGLVPGREANDDDSDNEELVDAGLFPGREPNNDDCDNVALGDGDCQHIGEVFDAVPGLIGDDNNDVVSSLSVIPNEILSHIIHLILASDLTMSGAINRVSEIFRECATVAMTNRWPRLHMSKSVAEALGLLPNCETTVSVKQFMRERLPGSGPACRLREFLVRNAVVQFMDHCDA